MWAWGCVRDREAPSCPRSRSPPRRSCSRSPAVIVAPTSPVVTAASTSTPMGSGCGPQISFQTAKLGGDSPTRADLPW
ncbi:hypothetical protein ZEAMMB73_Zm00001d039421 [Zea mays]|uniref:Uncharacterized protein n=1 Tax=Zea mays TaxID=4577 RepID=A0A1D6MH95_MAIZE|nr:hypothetical protein ZEAMMB73_Zm00001d039421 [Zea mays]ONM28708.1 hypothetical protein ZEAMMB73_Zm00001d039421 [Zea mays]ONM28711.1 hypothetical protein ZEAMMB73_Zm00001d039421 [Zea mays]ONM28713.1 hypothetical protein ZEAMMB73_Zm00001d039421 [Zea mays]ONM28714.1 hypothetical protein ZEAMMB73_Zm00001d039421 [Zea mays]